MKHKIIYSGIVCLILILGFTVYFGTIKNANSATSPEWMINKIDVANKHDAHNKETLKANENLKNTQIDYAKLKEGDPPNSRIGVYSIDQFPMQLPGMSQSQYKFTNVAEAKYDILFVGSSIDDPTKGIIIDLHTDHVTSQTSIKSYEIKNEGNIKIDNIDTDGMNVNFSTQTGEKGTFNTNNGTYKISWGL